MTIMARKNRVSVYDGVYHVTTRIANRAMLLAKDEVKDKIMEWVTEGPLVLRAGVNS